MAEVEKKVRTKAPAKPAAKKATKPAVDKTATKKPTAEKPADDRVTLAAICEELGMNPAAARRKLRAAEIERPEGQAWSWKPGRELDKIKKVLNGE